MHHNLLTTLSNIAQNMAEVGAEISRVEESMTRMCSAYGFERVEAYATTSQLVVSVETLDGDIKMLQRRIGGISTDIERLDRLNTLVRYVSENAPSIEEIETTLEEIKSTKKTKNSVLPVFYGIIAAAFCLFFDSRSLAEFLVSFVVGCFVGILCIVFEKGNINKLLNRFLCSFLAALTVRLFIKIGIVTNPDYIIIGNIMSLIPGIGITNALRDLFSGDTITGILRSIEALLLTVAIALGFALPSLLFGGGF